MLNIIVLDDEYEQLEGIKNLINEVCTYEYRLECVDCEEKLEECLEKDNYDILFLDIKLNKSNGIDLAEKILSDNPKLIIIFISGYTEYYEEVYRVEHIYFISKPLDAERIRKSIDKAANIIKERETRKLIVKTNEGIQGIYPEEIIYIESKGHNVIIYTKDGYYSGIGYKLDEIENSLNSLRYEIFIRCHKSYIVNIMKVNRIEKNIIALDSGNEISVSRKYSKKVRDTFNKYLGGILCI